MQHKIYPKNCVYIMDKWMQHKIQSNVFFLLVSTIFSLEKNEFLVSPLFFVISIFGAYFWKIIRKGKPQSFSNLFIMNLHWFLFPIYFPSTYLKPTKKSFVFFSIMDFHEMSFMFRSNVILPCHHNSILGQVFIV